LSPGPQCSATSRFRTPELLRDHDRAAAQVLARQHQAQRMSDAPSRRLAAGKRTEDGHPVHSFRTLLTDLANMTRNTVRFGTDLGTTLLVTPTALQAHALDLLGVAPTAEV
jgi:hypothetical protein